MSKESARERGREKEREKDYQQGALIKKHEVAFIDLCERKFKCIEKNPTENTDRDCARRRGDE